MLVKLRGGFLCFLALCSLALSQEWSQFRGNNARDGINREIKFDAPWGEKGPKQLWQATGLGLGFSSAAYSMGKLYTAGEFDGVAKLSCLAATNGKIIWQQEVGKSRDNNRYRGSRATPTVVGDKLYYLTAKGDLSCRRTSDGGLIWGFNLLERYGGTLNRWEMAQSPLVVNGVLYCSPGQAGAKVVALSALDGKEIWRTKIPGYDSPSYSGPIMINHQGKELLAGMLGNGAYLLNPTTGKLLAAVSHTTKYGINPNAPVYDNGYLTILSGYKYGSKCYKLNDAATELKLVWEDKELEPQFGAAVVFAGHIYSSSQNRKHWKCVEIATGKTKWVDRSLKRQGEIVAGKDKMLVFIETTGELALLKPNPEKFEKLASFHIDYGQPKKEFWAFPALQGGVMYVRHGQNMAAYQVDL